MSNTSLSIARLFFLLPAIVLATSGCGGDETVNGPPPTPIDVSGGWVWSGLLVGQGIQCFPQGTLQLSQSENQISGTYIMGPASCILADLSLFELNWGSGQITNGSINGIFTQQADVRLDFGSDWTNTGTVFAAAPNGMTGTSTVIIDFGGAIGRVTMDGSWSAVL